MDILKEKIENLRHKINNSKENIEYNRKKLQIYEYLNDCRREKEREQYINEIVSALSNIYQGKNEKISDMFKKLIINGTYENHQINKVNTLNKIIRSYNDWKKYKDHKNCDLLSSVKQFREIIIPNILKWDLSDLDIYSCLYKINEMNVNIVDIKEILNDLSKEKLIKLDIDKELLNYLDRLKIMSKSY